jgi:hypothetical protein
MNQYWLDRRERIVTLAIIGVLALCIYAFLVVVDHTYHGVRRRYRRLVPGMHIGAIREVMGGMEDNLNDDRTTESGLYVKSWTFDEEGRIDAVFDQDGRSTYFELNSTSDPRPLEKRLVSRKK